MLVNIQALEESAYKFYMRAKIIHEGCSLKRAKDKVITPVIWHIEHS